MLRSYSYALRGERAVCHRLQVRGQCISAVAAISSGLLATRPVNEEKFYDFVRGTLISEMLPFDGIYPRSICHHGQLLDAPRV